MFENSMGKHSDCKQTLTPSTGCFFVTNQLQNFSNTKYKMYKHYALPTDK